jgi:hypothetical protein
MSRPSARDDQWPPHPARPRATARRPAGVVDPTGDVDEDDGRAGRLRERTHRRGVEAGARRDDRGAVAFTTSSSFSAPGAVPF